MVQISGSFLGSEGSTIQLMSMYYTPHISRVLIRNICSLLSHWSPYIQIARDCSAIGKTSDKTHQFELPSVLLSMITGYVFESHFKRFILEQRGL